MTGCVSLSVSFLVACLLAFTIQVFFFSPISPDFLELPSASLASSFPKNKQLQEVTKLGEGLLEGPEDVWFDKEGVLYTACRDGWVKRMHKNGSWEDWWKIDSRGLLGITISKDGSLIVCDAENGLLKVSEEGVTFLASQFNGSQIRFADEAIESSDGSIYFSVPSTKFGFHDWYLDVLEAKPHGQLLKYDPTLNETTIVLNDLAFANGVALSKEEDFLIVCETWKYRCLRYWLNGEKAGTTDIFIDNLPGAPDNINLAPDGSFWIAQLQLVSSELKFVHTSKALKHFFASSPKLVKLINGVHKKGTVVNVAADGKITRKLDDPDGKVISFVTSAFEFEEHLYLGNLNTNFVGKLPLKAM